MSQSRTIWLCAFLLIAFASCAKQEYWRADPSKLAPWTKALRDEQPEDAFAAIYHAGDELLVFLGAKHSTATDSRTFALINEAYVIFDVDTVIVEGPPNSDGPNSQKLFDWVASKSRSDGFQEGGEIIPAVRGARELGVTVWGGEPDDSTIRDLALADGITLEELLGFYVLRSVPQWIRETKITGADDPAVRLLVESDLIRNRQRLGATGDIIVDYAGFSEWYTRINGKAFGVAFDNEETGPLVDGVYGSNRVAAAISRARDTFLLEFATERLNLGETVMVVFGASHLMIQRPALDAMLGQPCFVGETFARLTDC